MTADELAAFNEQIAGMAKAGLPLDQGLASLARDMARGRLRNITEALAADLRSGKTLPEALERRRAQLPPYYSALAAAGMRTGRLPDVLRTLTVYTRTVATTRAIVIEALFYPSLVLTLGVVVFAGMSMFVLPDFEELFREFKMPLPWPTVWLLVAGRNLFWVVGVPLVVLAVVVVVARWLAVRTLRGRQAWTAVVYSVPLVGTLMRYARLAAFTELLSVLVRHDIPLPEALQLAGDASSDPFLPGQAKLIRTRLEGGTPLGEALRGRGLLPEWVAWMTLSGERRGTLPETLTEVAAVYRRGVEARAGVLRNILPSVVIVGTAAVIALLFIVSVAAPMVRLIEGLSK